MNRLLRYDFSRFWGSCLPVIALVIAVAAGIVAMPVCPGYQAVSAYAQAYLFLVPVACVLTVIFITQEFSYGILRNKVVMGMRRPFILLSWAAVMTSVCIFLVAVYSATVAIAHKVIGYAVADNMSFETFLVNCCMTLQLMLAFVVITGLVCVLGNGYENIITILFIFFALAEIGVLTAAAARHNGVLRRVLALIPTTHLGDSVIEIPQTAVMTLVGGAVLIAAASALTVVLFRRKNLQ
jgi:hypothetical protein